MNKVFYEELWINEDSMEQNLITIYSIKYRDYQKSIRDFHVERAQKLMDSKSAKLDKSNPNDFRRFIGKKHCTVNGQIAEINMYSITMMSVNKR
jgi:hypothetical protein